jgi:hypothetical protein
MQSDPGALYIRASPNDWVAVGSVCRRDRSRPGREDDKRRTDVRLGIGGWRSGPNLEYLPLRGS